MTEIPAEFLEASRAVGADPLLIQGAGGNSSIKVHAKCMWVKASGKWLQQAGRDDVFVAVDPARVNQNIMAGFDDPTKGATLPDGPAGLRPSIETTLHSLMPQPVVFHSHSINTIVHAIQDQAEEILDPLLKSFKWAFVPYSKPGLPLTYHVANILAARDCDVLVIQNHGLVVGGDSPADTLARMRQVEECLGTTARPHLTARPVLLEKACTGTGFVVADDDAVHQLALDEVDLRIASGGSLYPDHVVFLGSGIACVETAEELTNFCQAPDNDPLRPKAVALAQAGVVHHKSLSAGGLEMLKALAEVCCRTPDDAAIRYLSSAEESELINWEAEKYRQTL